MNRETYPRPSTLCAAPLPARPFSLSPRNADVAANTTDAGRGSG